VGREPDLDALKDIVGETHDDAVERFERTVGALLATPPRPIKELAKKKPTADGQGRQRGTTGGKDPGKRN
jgi:hypothetical protein